MVRLWDTLWNGGGAIRVQNFNRRLVGVKRLEDEEGDTSFLVTRQAP